MLQVSENVYGNKCLRKKRGKTDEEDIGLQNRE